MTNTSDNTAIGSIDHVVIVVEKLASCADVYRRLGFTLSPRGVHSDALGTENHTIMLREDYFELLAVRLPTERNRQWRERLSTGGGVAGLALATSDPQGARAQWLAAGLVPDTPLKFAREVPRPDGSSLQARFEVVSLDEVAGTGLRLFVCSQPTREAVWLPELLEHANTALAIRRVRLACPDRDFSAAQWLRALPGARATSTATGIRLDTGRHHIDLARHAIAAARALGIDYQVADLARCRAVLERNAIAHTIEGTRIAVAPASACNVAIGFETGG